MKKTADNIRIIGKSDGPTSVFIAGKDKKKTLRQKIEKSMYDFRRKRVIKFLRADSHSVDEVADYVVRELGYTEVSSSDETYQTEYSNMRASFLLQYRPELLGDLTEPQRPQQWSQLPNAEKFESWLFDEVVPSIREKGYYGITDRGTLPEFIKRYKDNIHMIPSNYFFVISELYVRLYAELEKVGYAIPDKGAHGKTMMPDGSVGKLFARFMRENNSELWNQHKTYKHHFPDGRVVDALMYPIDALPMFIRYVNERWLYENAEKYFKERDPLALDYLPKLLESKKKSA